MRRTIRSSARMLYLLGGCRDLAASVLLHATRRWADAKAIGNRRGDSAGVRQRGRPTSTPARKEREPGTPGGAACRLPSTWPFGTRTKWGCCRTGPARDARSRNELPSPPWHSAQAGADQLSGVHDTVVNREQSWEPRFPRRVVARDELTRVGFDAGIAGNPRGDSRRVNERRARARQVLDAQEHAELLRRAGHQHRLALPLARLQRDPRVAHLAREQQRLEIRQRFVDDDRPQLRGLVHHVRAVLLQIPGSRLLDVDDAIESGRRGFAPEPQGVEQVGDIRAALVEVERILPGC